MSKPNVLILFTDDQRFDTIAALGNRVVKTPNLDRLVKRGVAFTHAHIPGGNCGAVCCPSRAMLHTGRTLFHLKGTGGTIPEEHVMMGEAFQQAGYRTFGTGKWHNSPPAYARSFTDGDEIFFGGMADHWNVPVNHFDPTGKYDQVKKKCLAAFSSNEEQIHICDHVHDGEHSSEILADAVVRFIDAYETEDPFMIYTAFLAPHDPRVMPDEFREMYNPDDMELPPNWVPEQPFESGIRHGRDEMLAPYPRTEKNTKKHIAEYYGIISHMDDCIGRILDALERSGKMDETIIVMAGDNGLAVGQHGLMGKQNLYDHSVRVPLMFSGPGLPADTRNDKLVYLLDVFPTLCDLCGIDIPDTVDGFTLEGTLKDSSVSVRDDLYLIFVGTHRGVTDGNFKLIEYVIDGKNTLTQLFDLREDPYETNNLADDVAHADRLAAMRARLRELADEWDDNKVLGQRFWAGMPE